MAYNEEKSFAVELAKRAGRMMSESFKLGAESWLKPDDTEVTKTDIMINRMVIEAVKKRFPGHDVLGEEQSDMSGKSTKLWVCDPIDGTSMFRHGIPMCVFSLAYVEDGVPMVGVVYDPFMDRMITAVKGEGAFLNNKPIKVSTNPNLKHALIYVCYWKGASFDISRLYKDLCDEDAYPIDLGSVAYSACMVAAGELFAAINPTKYSHDIAASKVIVEEAGGKVTDLFGNEQRYDGEIKGCIISNGLIHDKLVEIVKKTMV